MLRFDTAAISLICALSALSMASAQAPVVDKIDPPNWYATLPKPMLLLHGEQLGGAHITLSDPALVVERTVFFGERPLCAAVAFRIAG